MPLEKPTFVKKLLQQRTFNLLQNAMSDLEGISKKEFNTFDEYERRYIYKGPDTKENIEAWKTKIELKAVDNIKKKIKGAWGTFMRKLSFSERKIISQIEEDESVTQLEKISYLFMYANIYWSWKILPEKEFLKMQQELEKDLNTSSVKN